MKRPPASDKFDPAWIETVKDVLERQVLSHIPAPNGNFAPKSRYLCLMIRRCLDARHDRTLLDDRDYYGNKRIEGAGQLISLLFEDLFKSFNADIKRQADTELQNYHRSMAASSNRRPESQQYPDLFRQTPHEKISRGMQHAISSGNWNIKRFRIDRSGVSQVLSRFSFISSLGAMTRVKSQFEKSRKIAGPRALQPSQWGMLCPADTPEGEQCGLVKHLALLTHVTTDLEPASLRQICYSLGVQDANVLSGEEIHHVGNILVFLNGEILGVHRR